MFASIGRNSNMETDTAVGNEWLILCVRHMLMAGGNYWKQTRKHSVDNWNHWLKHPQLDTKTLGCLGQRQKSR